MRWRQHQYWNVTLMYEPCLYQVPWLLGSGWVVASAPVNLVLGWVVREGWVAGSELGQTQTSIRHQESGRIQQPPWRCVNCCEDVRICRA